MKKTVISLLYVVASFSVLGVACDGRERDREHPPQVTDAGVVDAGEEPFDAGTEDAGSDAGPDAGSEAPDAGPTEFANLRIMTANLTSSASETYDPGNGIRLMQAVQPDVVLIQRFNYARNIQEDLQSMVDRVGVGYSFARESGATQPNGIISRWPILASGEWDDPLTAERDFAWARIDIPGPKDLWAVSVNLLTTHKDLRKDEVDHLIQRMHFEVPMDDYVVIGGSLNTDTLDEPCFDVLRQLVITTGPYPADAAGNTNTDADRKKPQDHVLVDPGLRELQTATLIGRSAFPGGLVLDSRVYSPLGDISPALAGDSGVTNMKHMGVVKDFVIPVEW